MLRIHTYFKSFWLILLFLTTQKISAQTAGQIRLIDRSVNPGGIIDELPPAPPKTIGSTYIDDEWRIGKLTLITNKELIGYPMKYDLKHEYLEINYQGQVKICPIEKIKSFSWGQYNNNDSLHFVNSRYISKVKNNNPRTILSKLYTGIKTSLYKEYYLELKEATYVTALDMGEKNNKILVKKAYYLLNMDTFYKLSSSLKKNKSVFGDYYNSVESYQKNNKLKLKGEEDMVKLIEYYESLL